MPDRNWQDKVGKDPRRPWQDRSLVSAPDLGLDALVEVIDLTQMAVIASFRVDTLLRYIVGPGTFAQYGGDLPYPQLEIIQIPLSPKEES
jgi:hypothetical protein